jgi:hypothetical protein
LTPIRRDVRAADKINVAQIAAADFTETLAWACDMA